MDLLLTPQRLHRLRELAQEEGAVLYDDTSVFTAPIQRPSFRIPDDDRKADAVLGQLRIEEAQSRPQPSGFKRAFSAGKKPDTPYTHKELHAALTRVIDENGLVGVAEVLLSRFSNMGGDINYSRRASTGLARKMRNSDNQDERGRLLQTSAEFSRLDFVQLLAPYADSASLDESLQISLRHKHIGIIETLIRYGANASLYEAVFQSAAKKGECDIIELFIRASKPISTQCVTQNLLHTTISGSLKAVLLLTRAGANCEYDNASSLMYAVQTGRTDLTLALLLGSNPPSPKSLDMALDAIFSDSACNLNDKHLLVEVLLCSCGHAGTAANEGLFKATFLVNEEMMQLLLEYGADINYNNACAIGHAIQRNRNDLVAHLLRDQNLRPEFASEVVGRIPRTAPSPVKVSILSMLLVNGATGHYCNELLVTAADTDDIDTAQLLVSYGKDENLSSVVSVDYNAAQALQIAVGRGNLALVKILVFEGAPSKFSLSKAFPMIPKDHEGNQFLMTEALLRAGAEGSEVDAALQAAVTGQRRSSRLVELFIQSGVQVNGQTLISIVTQGNVEILKVLLSGKSSPAICSAAVSVAMKQHTKSTRYHLIKLLLPNATLAGPENIEIPQALIDLLQKSPEDTPLLKLLCFEGKADINFQLGQAVFLATRSSISDVLDIILQSTGPPPSLPTISRGLACAIELSPLDENRHRKVQVLLARGRPQEALNHALIQEIQEALTIKRDLSVLKTLLASADVNFSEGAPVCYAVRDPAIMDLVLARRPSPHSISMAFPLAMVMPEPARFTLCEKLLKIGAVGPEITLALSKALYLAVKEGPPALQLIKILLPQSDVNYRDGRALKQAVRGVFHDAVDILLIQRPTMPTVATRIRAFQEAMMLLEPQDRFDMTKKLLAAGTSGKVISEALITASNWKDLRLTELLLNSGASVDYQGGKAIHAAASSGNRDVLQALVGGKFCPKPNLSSLTAGFGGAMSLKEKDLYYSIIQVLLAAGMKGDAVDVALVEAVKEGDANIRLTELIYSSGASVEWNDGEALEVAAKSASINTLTLLLQAKPEQNALKRAYRSSLSLPKDQRFLVIEQILKAGKTIDKHVTNTLFKATLENPADRELIRLLLDYQVFDEGESMAHAADVLDSETLALLTNSSHAKPYISTVFGDVMATAKPWQSNKGMDIAELLLQKGAGGDAVGEAFVNAVERCETGADTLATEFLDLLLRHANVNYRRGLPLQRAAQQANVGLIQKLIHGATTDSKAMAMCYLFTSYSDETAILSMIDAFTDATDRERRLDIDFKHPDPELEPVLFMALKQYPRKAQVLKALLNNGFNPNEWHFCVIDEEVGEEAYSILCWAIAQPQKGISNANIELLIESGANVNFNSKSGINPIVLSIKHQRPDILEKLISKGAKVTVADNNGITPLAFASRVGNSTVMAHLLKAGAEINDGSLHDAARELHCEAMRVLIRFNHEVDFPSDRHEGRSALAELCLRAAENGPNPIMEEAIECLVANRADVRLRFSGGKTIFHFALDSSDPLSILRVLLKVLWKVINEDVYLFNDGNYTYSLTKYVEKGLSSGPDVQREEIVQLLHQKRAYDKYWANELDVPQPADFCGAPQSIIDEVNRQKAQARRFAAQRQETLHQIELQRLSAVEDRRLLRERTDHEIRLDLEKARMHDSILETRANQQLRLDSRAEQELLRLASIKHSNELNHVRAIGDAQVSTQRRIGEVKIENEQTEHMLAIEYVQAKTDKENEGLQSRLAIESSGREDADRIQTRMHEREMARIRSQKQLTDSHTALASNLRSTGMNQRQIGYITGEVQ